MTAGTVVPSCAALDEREFHDRLTAGWSRCIPLLGGREAFALSLGMTKRGLNKVLGGSTPHACTILNSRRAHPSALDELLAGYAVRIVPASAICSTDAGAGLVMLKAAAACVEAEADGIDHRELLAMEAPLRASAEVHARLLARIDGIKGVGR